MDMQLFATRLKQVRESQNISAEELAEAVGFNKATIFRYEKAEFKSVKQPVLEAIAKYLNVNPDYLTGKSDDRYVVDNIKAFSEKEKKEIDDVVNMTTELLRQEGLTFNGEPVDRENIEAIIDAMQIGLEMAKRRNRQKYGRKNKKGE